MDPEEELRIQGLVAGTEVGPGDAIDDRPPDPAVEADEPFHLPPGDDRRTVDDGEVRTKRRPEAGPGIRPEGRVGGHALGDEGMGDLEEEGPGTRPEEEDGFTVEPPGLASGTVPAGRARYGRRSPRRRRIARAALPAGRRLLSGARLRAFGARLRAFGTRERCPVARQRSSGSRPTTHQATGKAAPARPSLMRSPTMKGRTPFWIASARGIPVAAMSHGTPTR